MPSYVDFCLSELKSLLEMFSLDWREVFKHEFLATTIETKGVEDSEKNGKNKEEKDEDISCFDDEKGYFYYYY